MENINSFEINNLIKLTDVEMDLYPKKMDINKSNKNKLEQFVYNIAISHKDNELEFVEYFFKNMNDMSFKPFCIENMQTTSPSSIVNSCKAGVLNEKIYNQIETKCLFTTLTFFENDNNPLFITNITNDDYKYKDFDNYSEFYIIYPKEGKHIVINPDNYFGFIESSNNFVLIINIYGKIKGIDNKINNDFLIKNFNITEINPTFNIDHIFFENLLYKGIIDKNISNLFPSNSDNDIFYNKKDIKNEKQILKILDNDIKQMSNNTIIYNRFIQRIKYSDFFSKEICQWLINESENYCNTNGWIIINNESFILIDKITSIFQFVISYMQNIITKIKKLYSLDSKCNMNIMNICIVKYDTNNNEMHNDKHIIKFIISLSENSEIYFEDGITCQLQQGDLYIHCGLTKNYTIIKESTYLLIGFIDII